MKLTMNPSVRAIAALAVCLSLTGAAGAIAAALQETNGNVTNTEAFRTAMLKANFKSLRGNFTFGANQHPIQDWWATRCERNSAGQLEIKTLRKVLENHGDNYAAQCRL